ncbi:hypothetical protein AUC43_00940 [Hymenobacter sedentarius]|uniref:YARHG domain-containing protein n=1 Tax=Hymenobacter sedentarius TaxID=1411621 RepID=A0A0U4AJN9_9BACT|nr:hypothetical protein [Hymenobacter sedentarius]ALW83792.1 hypothetical protein AUC43_00940 [Hymenobacter sedentarius]
MRLFFLLFTALAGIVPAAAQQAPATTFHATERRVNNLMHTKLDVWFEYAKRYLYGKTWVTVKPHVGLTEAQLRQLLTVGEAAVGTVQAARPAPC